MKIGGLLQILLNNEHLKVFGSQQTQKFFNWKNLFLFEKIKFEPLIKERCHHQRIVDGMPLNYCEYEPGVSANQEKLRIKSHEKKNISK